VAEFLAKCDVVVIYYRIGRENFLHLKELKEAHDSVTLDWQGKVVGYLFGPTHSLHKRTRARLDPVADLGGAGKGAAAPPLASFRKNSGSTNFENSEDSTIIIITNFYLAASSHEIFLRVGGREGMKGLGVLQRHQLPHLLAKILDPPLLRPNPPRSASPVLTATGFVNGRWQYLTPRESTPLNRSQKSCC